MKTFSIILPVLNESDDIRGIIGRLNDIRAQENEIIIVDGGSTDATVSLLTQAGFRVLSGGMGRGLALNLGARAARGDVLVLLHADTHLPPPWRPLILEALSDPRCVWGRFDVLIEGRSVLLPMVGALMNIRSRLTGIATGDQAIFIQRAAYERIGGIPEQPLMEDIELSRRLKKLSRPACLRAKVTTSGRRWDRRGVVRTILEMWTLRALYFFGLSPERAYRIYKKS